MSGYSLAKEIITRAFPQERLVPQPEREWCGDFSLPVEVACYYAELGPNNVTIDAYGNPFFLPSLASLWDFQVGYRFHPKTMERFEGWSADWFVVGYQGGDPFIFSRSSSRILYALHGRGAWDANELFRSLEAMVTTFAIIGDVVVGAGDDLTDEESYLKGRYVKKVEERVVDALGSKGEAEIVLNSLSWVSRS
ncbi:hypothetical protein NDA01_11735 [Trichocoleus desertorum AS-A10]|uniref:hypothetical protein n=1 Tax=Trichocoleus desertorum TaxID=1481672 RepID=UPI00329716DD